MSTERAIKVVKANQQFQNMQNNVASSEVNCAKIRDDELRRRWDELRRAFIALDKFITESF